LLCPVASLKYMTMNQCALGCWLGRSGEGAAALFSKGKIDFLLGGWWWDCLHFQLGGQNQTLRPVDSVENMAIKRRMEGLRLKGPADVVVTSFFEGDFGHFLRTLQSTSVRGGGGWNGQGMVWQLREGERWRCSTSLMIARLWVMTLSAMTPIRQQRPRK
jgi:hypothetical protein